MISVNDCQAVKNSGHMQYVVEFVNSTLDAKLHNSLYSVL